jgi:hypothetical protein
MNIEYLTKDMWNTIRTWEYETLIKVSAMLQPVEEEVY